MASELANLHFGAKVAFSPSYCKLVYVQCMYNCIRVRVILQTYDEKSYAPIGQYPIIRRHSSARGRTVADGWGNYLNDLIDANLYLRPKWDTLTDLRPKTVSPGTHSDPKNTKKLF